MHFNQYACQCVFLYKQYQVCFSNHRVYKYQVRCVPMPNHSMYSYSLMPYIEYASLSIVLLPCHTISLISYARNAILIINMLCLYISVYSCIFHLLHWRIYISMFVLVMLSQIIETTYSYHVTLIINMSCGYLHAYSCILHLSCII